MRETDPSEITYGEKISICVVGVISTNISTKPNTLYLGCDFFFLFLRSHIGRVRCKARYCQQYDKFNESMQEYGAISKSRKHEIYAYD